MQYFIDTASLDDIKFWKENGLVEGVTTNPALLAVEGVDPIERVKAIASVVDGPISVEVTHEEPDKMVKHAERLSTIHPNIVIKVPASLEGLDAAKELKKHGMLFEGYEVPSPEILKDENISVLISSYE